MAAALRVHDYEIRQRLGDLGVDLAVLQRVLTAGWLAQQSCTKDDPLGYPGIHRWGVMTRTLRQELRPRGWVASDDASLAVALAPDGTLAICVSTGDAGTGRSDRTPATKYRKGVATLCAVEINRAQLDLFGIHAVRDSEKISGPITWILLSDLKDGVVFAELSLPLAVGDDGRVDTWKERIIFPALTLGSVTDAQAEFTPEVDIDVPRRP